MYSSIVAYFTSPQEAERPKDWWKRPRRKPEVRYRPRLTQLERRELLACSQPGSPPWCLDVSFDSDGYTKGDIPLRFEEARAMIIQKVDIDPGQDVNLQERALLGGHALNTVITTASDTALIRLCPNGGLDNGSNCEGNGFGLPHPITGKGLAHV